VEAKHALEIGDQAILKFKNSTTPDDFDLTVCNNIIGTLKKSCKDVLHKGNKALAQLCERKAAVLQHFATYIKEHLKAEETCFVKDLSTISALIVQIEASIGHDGMPMWMRRAVLVHAWVQQFRISSDATTSIFSEMATDKLSAIFTACGNDPGDGTGDLPAENKALESVVLTQSFAVMALVRNSFAHTGSTNYDSSILLLQKVMEVAVSGKLEPPAMDLAKHIDSLLCAARGSPTMDPENVVNTLALVQAGKDAAPWSYVAGLNHFRKLMNTARGMAEAHAVKQYAVSQLEQAQTSVQQLPLDGLFQYLHATVKTLTQSGKLTEEHNGGLHGVIQSALTKALTKYKEIQDKSTAYFEKSIEVVEGDRTELELTSQEHLQIEKVFSQVT